MEIHVVWGQMVSEVMVPDASPAVVQPNFLDGSLSIYRRVNRLEVWRA